MLSVRLTPEMESRLDRLCRETGWCLELHDLVLSKYAAGREKDLRFNEELILTGRIDRRRLLSLLRTLPVSEAARRRISRLVERAFG